jgi:cell division topological specificity factor
MLKELFDKIVPWQESSRTRYRAKNRLQLVIAHDRAGINPELLDKMRQEILEVVTRYIEIDTAEMELSIDTTDRMTALTANFPIKKIKRTPSNS